MAEAGAPPAENQAELRQMIEIERQKALFQTAVHKFHAICFEKCLSGAPKKKIDAADIQCLTQCVERYFDTHYFVAKRINDKRAKQ